MKLHVQGTEPAQSQNYEGENLTFEVKSGFLNVFEGDNLIGKHNQNMWAYVSIRED